VTGCVKIRDEGPAYRWSILHTLAWGALLVTPICGWVFSCGCNWPWAGLAAHCNYFLASAPPPHCPWCVQPVLGLTAIGFALAAGAFLALRRRPSSERTPLAFIDWVLCGTAGFIVTLLAAGLFTALAVDYPSFLGFLLR